MDVSNPRQQATFSCLLVGGGTASVGAYHRRLRGYRHRGSPQTWHLQSTERTTEVLKRPPVGRHTGVCAELSYQQQPQGTCGLQEMQRNNRLHSNIRTSLATSEKMLANLDSQELISRLDSQTLPLEPRHRAKQRAKHLSAERCACKLFADKTRPRWRDSYSRPTIWSIDRPHLQWSWTIRFRGNASTLNIVIFINHTWWQTYNANIRKKTTKVRKKYMSLTVRLQDKHRLTSKTLHTPY